MSKNTPKQVAILSARRRSAFLPATSPYAKHVCVARLPEPDQPPGRLAKVAKTCPTIFLEAPADDFAMLRVDTATHLAAYKLNALAAANHQLDRRVILCGPVKCGTTADLIHLCGFLKFAYSTQPPFEQGQNHAEESTGLPIILGGDPTACASAHEIFHSWFSRRPVVILTANQAEFVGLLRAWGSLATQEDSAKAEAVLRLAEETGIPLGMARGLAFGAAGSVE